MTNTIYQITNTINNKIYIGVHTTNNPNDNYMGSGIAIKQAIEKYGKVNFKKDILFEYDNLKEAYSKENEIVNDEFIKRKDTYNMMNGGLARIHFTDEHKTKISKSLIGRTKTKEHILNHSNSLLGFKHSLNTKNKMSISKQGKLNNQFKGYYITPLGRYDTLKKVKIPLLPNSTLFRWCKNSNKIINSYYISRSKYLQSLKESPLDKTFKEIGFNFESI